jgi:hypothetical protein
MGHTFRISQSQASAESEAFVSEEPRLPWLTIVISLIIALNTASLVFSLLAH